MTMAGHRFIEPCGSLEGKDTCWYCGGRQAGHPDERPYVPCAGCGLRNYETNNLVWNCPDFPKCAEALIAEEFGLEQTPPLSGQIPASSVAEGKSEASLMMVHRADS